jgi:formylmethanofuran dehydrogenase subunit B
MNPAREFDNVPCPFCGLLCDDLGVTAAAGALSVRANGCARSRRLFAAHAPGMAAAIEGKTAALEAATARAADVLRAATRPLLLSAGTDVAGMRALVALAERTGGRVGHVNHAAMLRNMRVLQDTGWVSTTLTEIRNRADLLVVAGAEVGSRFPRFFERCFGGFDTLFETGARELIFLGTPPPDLPEALRARSTVLAIDPERLAELFGALRALLAGRHLRAPALAALSREQLSTLVTRLRAAKYGVLTWAAGEFDFDHADLTVQAMCELVQDLNRVTRFSVLPLGGSDGDLTALQVTTWQTGFAVGVDFARGAPVPAGPVDPLRLRQPAADADALVFVSAFDADRTLPPDTNIPSVVLGRAGMRADSASVFIPVAVPGLHHSGHLYRTDNVVAMRMRELAPSAYPAAGRVLENILCALGEEP